MSHHRTRGRPALHAYILTDEATAALALANQCAAEVCGVSATIVASSVTALQMCSNHSQRRVLLADLAGDNLDDPYLETSVFSPKARRLQWLKFIVMAEQSLRRPNTPWVMTDADVIWLQPKAADVIVNACNSGSVDVLTMDQGGGEGEYVARANAGFIVNCGTPRAAEFWRALAANRLGWNASSRAANGVPEWRGGIYSLDARLAEHHEKARPGAPWLNDQSVLNYELLLARGLRWELLNSTAFANGCTIKDMSRAERREHVLAFHGTCLDGVGTKAEWMAEPMRGWRDDSGATTEPGRHGTATATQSRRSHRLAHCAQPLHSSGLVAPHASNSTWLVSTCDKGEEAVGEEIMKTSTAAACARRWARVSKRRVSAVMFAVSLGERTGECRPFRSAVCAESKVPSGWVALDRP